MKLIEKYFGSFSATIGIVGLVLTLFLYFIDKLWAAVICLGTVTILFVSLFWVLIRILNRHLRTEYPDEATLESAFIRLSSDNGEIFHYDSYRTVMCRRLFLTEYKQRFRWYSNTPPDKNAVTSNLQDVTEIISTAEEGDFHTAILSLREPIRFNQCAVIHLHSVDSEPEPHLDASISGNGIKLIHYTVELNYKPETFNSVAILEWRKKNSRLATDFKELKKIPFNKASKTYSCPIENPKIDYFYRLRWEK